MTKELKTGDRVRVWPGVRSGRSAETTVHTRHTMCGVPGAYVKASTDSDGRRVPSGFYAMTHIERVEDG